MKRVTLKIYGRVQGVFFRQTSRGEARKLGINGWVRNEPDGEVIIVAEGEEKNLREFVRWCERGPMFAKVDNTEEEWVEATGEFDDFAIR